MNSKLDPVSQGALNLVKEISFYKSKKPTYPTNLKNNGLLFDDTYLKGHYNTGGLQYISGLGDIGKQSDNFVNYHTGYDTEEVPTHNFETIRRDAYYWDTIKWKNIKKDNCDHVKSLPGPKIEIAYNQSHQKGYKNNTDHKYLANMYTVTKNNFKHMKDDNEEKLPKTPFFIRVGDKSKYGLQKNVENSSDGYSIAAKLEPDEMTTYNRTNAHKRGYLPSGRYAGFKAR